MAPNPRIKQAFRSMEEIGISKEKVKPVLKKLLKLYDKNWELIESENYRVLADAIFEEDDSKVPEQEADKNSDVEDIEEEGSVPDEVVRPLKRRRLRKKYDQESCSHGNDSSNVAGTFFKKPKVEEDELPPAPLQQQSLQCNVGNIGTESLPTLTGPVSSRPTSPAPVSPLHGGRNKGKQTIEHSPLAVQERPKPNSHSSQMDVSHKGKEPISPHVASNRNGLERASLALCIKDPAPEPGISPKKSVPVTHALVIPKEEPITDVIPGDEIPIAVIHPDSLSERGLSVGDFSTAKSNWQEPSASRSERHSSCDLATAPEEIPSSLEIASTPLGEVKISLSYNSALGRPNFRLPSVDELRELMEQRCLRSYKLIDPNFDVFKVLGDMCECILELATSSSNNLQEVNVMPALDVLKKSSARDALSNSENGCLLARMLNESFNAQCSTNGFVDNVGGKELVVVPQHELTPDELRFCLFGIGDESCCQTCFGDCLLSQQLCTCARHSGGNFVYTSAGVLKEDFLEECITMTRDPQQQCLLSCVECPLERSKKDDVLEPCKGHLKRNVIKECWSKCGCNKRCGNRVVQRGVNYKLQVFLTPDGKGWGLRTLEKLPKGAFVCEFVGEILTISELYTRNREKHASPVLLDAYWGLTGVSMDEEALCLDATCYGNVARFINHRCFDANLIEIPVEVESPDLHYYHLAFFTTREVEALEELTWDYGLDFGDLDHPVKQFQCRCGSTFCRNMKRSTNVSMVQGLIRHDHQMN
ncbi:hypothetical protein V6N13_046101 [Hibiscus sabdariffa]